MLNTVQEGFRNVDFVSNPNYLFDFLDYVNQLDTVKSCQQKMRNLLQLETGDHILLDVGCGLGHETQQIAQILRHGSRVIGLDYSEEIIKEAKKRTEELNLFIEFYQGDVHSLPFTDNYFDGCRAERVFMYLNNPQQALNEMIRVVRPGGKIVIYDFYHDACVINSDNQALNRKLVQFSSDNFPHGSIGVKLPGLFEDLGLIDINVIPHSFLGSYEIYLRFFDQI